jgi:hypothetical protein
VVAPGRDALGQARREGEHGVLSSGRAGLIVTFVASSMSVMAGKPGTVNPG